MQAFLRGDVPAQVDVRVDQSRREQAFAEVNIGLAACRAHCRDLAVSDFDVDVLSDIGSAVKQDPCAYHEGDVVRANGDGRRDENTRDQNGEKQTPAHARITHPSPFRFGRNLQKKQPAGFGNICNAQGKRIGVPRQPINFRGNLGRRELAHGQLGRSHQQMGSASPPRYG
ncbi:MAG: hypothetical protein WD207_02075, partial [Xanthobacteraceae bacterium]